MSEALRHAALTLHAMHPDDRQWALHALDGQQRDALMPLLDELRELGIPQDPTLLSSLSEPDTVRPVPPAGQDGIDLDAMPADVVTAVLRSEPVRYVELLLGLHPWAWRNAWPVAKTAARSVERAGEQAISPQLGESMVRHTRNACEAYMARGAHGRAQGRDSEPAPKSGFATWTQRWTQRRSRSRAGSAS
ncbi:hypothetical protein ACPWR0_23275 [Pandoraea pneumonica]|uniref:hypothetical protein n=1 Tax=Pandoraea pneumonica TaxID=2508299 RepID=UPI003CE7D4C6